VSLRRAASLCVLSLGLTALGALPAIASTGGETGTKVVSGERVDVRRAPASHPSGRASLRRQSLVANEPAAHKTSTWVVTYDSGFNANPAAKAAFQRAVDVWASIITSAVTIKVTATFADLGEGVLGSAGPAALFQSPSIGDGVSYYPDALADALKGADQRPGSPDIDAAFSSTEPGIYYGTDGNPPSGYVDFESVVLHELGHGLGFLGGASYDSGNGSFSFLTKFDRYLSNSAGTALTTYPNNSTQLGIAFTSNAVYWNGPKAVAADSGNKPQVYSPNPWEQGSSIGHVDEAAYPANDVNSLMTPYIENNEVIHRPGPIIVGMFQDLGFVATLSAPNKPTNVVGSPQSQAVSLSWIAATENGSPISGYTISVSDGREIVSNGTGTSAVIGGLTNDTAYTFKVKATNGIGTSDWSTISAPVIPTSGTTPTPTPSATPSATPSPAPSATPSATPSPTPPPTTSPSAADTTAPTVAFQGIPSVTSTAGSFGFTGSDPGHPSEALTFTCALDSAALSACSSPFTFSGLTGGSHALHVAAKDSSGNSTSPATTATWTVDAAGPTVTFVSSPGSATPDSSATFEVSGTDDISPAGQLTYRCRIDSGTISLCPTSSTYSGLSDGMHTFTVAAVDQVGNQGPAATRSFRVDTANPTVTANVLPVFTAGTTVGLRYSGTDSGVGVSSYDLRYRRAAFNGTFGTLTYPAAWQGSTATVQTMATSAGYTYCFSVLSRDGLGHSSPWSPERCTASTLDDRSLAASTGWTRGTSSAYFAGTVTSATATGRTLTRSSVQARRIAIVATTCSGCGSIGVYWNNALIKTVSLNASTTTYKHVLAVADLGAVKAGTLLLKTTNANRTYVDGVALSRV
jgi:hypothetical protein